MDSTTKERCIVEYASHCLNDMTIDQIYELAHDLLSEQFRNRKWVELKEEIYDFAPYILED